MESKEAKARFKHIVRQLNYNHHPFILIEKLFKEACNEILNEDQKTKPKQTAKQIDLLNAIAEDENPITPD